MSLPVFEKIIANSKFQMNEKEIGLYIEQQRELRGWTQEYLAQKIEVSKKTIYNIEKGKFTNHNNVNKILHLFGFKLGFGLIPEIK